MECPYLLDRHNTNIPKSAMSPECEALPRLPRIKTCPTRNILFVSWNTAFANCNHLGFSNQAAVLWQTNDEFQVLFWRKSIFMRSLWRHRQVIAQSRLYLNWSVSILTKKITESYHHNSLWLFLLELHSPQGHKQLNKVPTLDRLSKQENTNNSQIIHYANNCNEMQLNDSFIIDCIILPL